MSIKGYFFTIIGAIIAAFIVVGGAANAAEPPVTPTAPVTTQAVICDPSECDPDEGETISADELAELANPEPAVTTSPAASAALEEDEPGWDCKIHGNKVCGPAVAPAAPAVAAAPATRPHYEEDDPQWDCYLDGNKICGPAVEGLTVEAWNAFDPSGFPAETLALPFKVTYLGTVTIGADLPPSTHYTIHSSKPGIDHAFKIETGVNN